VSDEREDPLKRHRRYRLAGIGDASSSSRLPAGHVDDLTAAYALGALDADEAMLVDAHARICSACDTALAEAHRTAGMLAFLSPMHTPPADAKAALFARVAHAHKAALASALPTHNLDAFRTPTLPSSADLDLVPPSSAVVVEAAPAASRRGRGGLVASVLSLPLLIALIATGFWGVQLQNRLSAQNAQVADLQSQLANFGSGTTSYPLSPGMAAPMAEGQIVMGANQRAGMVQIDLNSNQGAGDYEMLVMQDGKLVPAAEVTVNKDGQGQAQFELAKPFSEYESVHIKAKPVAAGSTDSAVTQFDALTRDADGSLGSTGSGLDVMP